MKKLALAATVLACLTACAGASAYVLHANGASKRGALVQIVKSRYGRVVADGKGEALYLFTADSAGPSTCYGDCAVTWPPFYTSVRPRRGTGVPRGVLGTTRRSDGRLQVTYRGSPLYYFKGDRPGLILCQKADEFGGLWLVVSPSGRAVQ